MPNGGPTPDCVHCKFFKGEIGDWSSYRCEKHKISLAFSIRAFCSAFEDLEGEAWLEQELAGQELDSQTMYVWLERKKPDENHRLFFHVPLTSIQDYDHWSSEKFLEELARLSEQYLSTKD
jgi:hypothetical protein